MKFLKSKRERLLFIATMVVVIGIGGFFFVYQPLANGWVSMNEEIDSLEMSLEGMRVKIRKDKNDEARYLAMKEKLELPGTEQQQEMAILTEVSPAAAGSVSSVWLTCSW